MVIAQLYDLVRTLYYKTIGFDATSIETMNKSLVCYETSTLMTIFELGLILNDINENTLIYEGFDRVATNTIITAGDKSDKNYIELIKKFTLLLAFEVNFKTEGKPNPFYNLYDNIYQLIADNNKAYDELGDITSSTYVYLPINENTKKPHGVSIIVGIYLLKQFIVELNTPIIAYMKADSRISKMRGTNER